MTTSANVMQQGRVFGNFVGGRWIPVDDSGALARRNPADQRDLIGYIPRGSADDVQSAVDAAASALDGWRATPAPTRGRILLRAAALIEQRRKEFAMLVTREQGKTLSESRAEVDMTVKVLEYTAGEGRRMTGETLVSERPGHFVYTIRQPIGIVGLITPWNYPVVVPAWKIAPALVTGNTIIWKPSRLTPLSSEALMQLFVDAGVPAGVLNVVNGGGSVAGAALATHPSVRAISFTASYEVGTQIYANAARLFKKVQCEAGGKNAVIVLADADLERAADSIIVGALQCAGQRCSATSRVVVVEEVADALAEMLVKRSTALQVGNGVTPGTDMGPIADETQLPRILEAIEIGKREATLLCGGERLSGPTHRHGLFVSPTIFEHVAPTSHVAQEEIFGPVLSLMRVRDFADAITVSNANRFGMCASVFSRDANCLREAAERLECGIVHLNAPTISAEVQAPFGGIKHTGVGDRELGSNATHFYTELKVVYA